MASGKMRDDTTIITEDVCNAIHGVDRVTASSPSHHHTAEPITQRHRPEKMRQNPLTPMLHLMEYGCQENVRAPPGWR